MLHNRDVTKPNIMTNFRTAPFVKLYEATPDPRGFLESVLGFSGLADTYIRISSADQRKYFGRTPFGKCAIKVSESGVFKLIKTKAFGRDFDEISFVLDPAKNTFFSMWDGREVKTPANI